MPRPWFGGDATIVAGPVTAAGTACACERLLRIGALDLQGSGLPFGCDPGTRTLAGTAPAWDAPLASHGTHRAGRVAPPAGLHTEGHRSRVRVRHYHRLSHRGGGWSDPLECNPTAGLNDVRQGYALFESARDDYDEVLTADGHEHDGAVTARLRNRRRQADGDRTTSEGAGPWQA